MLRSLASRPLVGALVLGVGAGCTALLSTPPQCETNADCAERGLANAVCVAQACVATADGGGGAGGGSTATGPWDCLGRVVIPPYTVDTIPRYVTFIDVNGEPLSSGLRVRVCNQSDPNCSQPIAEVQPDAEGVFAYQLSADAQGTYVEAQGPELACCPDTTDDCCTTSLVIDNLVNGGGGGAGGAGPDVACCEQQLVPALLIDAKVREPFPEPKDLAPVTMVTRLAVAQLLLISGYDFQEEDHGIALTLALDCNQQPAAGVRIVPDDTGSTVFYFDGLLPDPRLDGTLAGGNAGVLNVPAKNAQGMPSAAGARVTAERAETGQFIAAVNFLVRPGWLTNVAIEPTP